MGSGCMGCQQRDKWLAEAREALRTARALAHRAKVRLLELEGYADNGLADEIEEFIESGPFPEDLTDQRARPDTTGGGRG